MLPMTLPAVRLLEWILIPHKQGLWGDIGFEGITGLAFLPDGRLVGSANDDGAGKVSILINVNIGKGTGSLIGTIGEQSGGGGVGCGRVPDLSVDPLTNTLFATGRACQGGDPFLLTIDPDNAQGTLIGDYLPFDGAGNGFAISDAGVFFRSRGTK